MVNKSAAAYGKSLKGTELFQKYPDQKEWSLKTGSSSVFKGTIINGTVC